MARISASFRILRRLLGAQLPQGTEPVFEVVGPGNLAVSNGLDIDRHDPEALAGMRHPEEIPSRRSSHLAAYDDAIPGDENFLDLELHVGDGLGKASDHFDRGIAAPAFAGKIAPARLVVRGEDLLLERLHIALDRLVEQAVPRGDHGARLSLGQTLCRGGQGTGQHGGGGDELSEPLHGVPPWSESSIDPCAINDLGTLALVVALPASQLSANRDVKIGLGLVPASIGETVSEHRSTTLGFRLRSLVLKNIPDSADDTPMESRALTSTTPSIKKWPISETFRRLKTIYWITGGWAARLSTSLPHRDTHGPLLTCPAQSSMGGQPQNRRLRRFTGASDFLDASSAVSNNISVP